jgi:hypothetical protein
VSYRPPTQPWIFSGPQGFGPLQQRDGADRFGLYLKWLLNSRQIDLEHDPFAYLAANVDVTAGLLDDRFSWSSLNRLVFGVTIRIPKKGSEESST